MNTTTLVAAFIVVVSGLIWIGTQSNDTGWAGNRNQCVGECYDCLLYTSPSPRD